MELEEGAEGIIPHGRMHEGLRAQASFSRTTAPRREIEGGIAPCLFMREHEHPCIHAPSAGGGGVLPRQTQISRLIHEEE